MIDELSKAMGVTSAFLFYLKAAENPQSHLIKAVAEALERGHQIDAVKAFRQVPFGGMGTFTDWQPMEDK